MLREELDVSMMQNVAESSTRNARIYERNLITRRVELESGQNRQWAAWIRRIAVGDMDALAALYDKSSTAVFSLVLHILQDRRVAEEKLIEIYDRVRREAYMFSEYDQVASVWLMTLARDAAVAQLRADSDARLEAFEQRQRAVHFICDGLTKEQDSILHMTYLGGFTAEEVAVLMDLSVEYVRRQIVAAMNKMRGRAARGFAL